MTAVYENITPFQRWLVVGSVMTATLMQVLDTTIVNVALPHMQGSLGATPDEITWTLTSYLVAAGIFMPLSGYLSDKLGRKNYLLISITGFTLASILCGLSQSLTQIVAFRLLQGIFGAGLVPLSQAILADIFPDEERGKAMAIWGIGVMIGPILGPTLGGYLTEVLNWRWTFYINVPVGLLALILAWQVVPSSEKKQRFMDWIGLILLSTAIGSLQYFLDRGNQQDWLNAIDIRVAVFLFVFGLVGFIIYNFKFATHTVFELYIFKDRNFTIASILLGVFGLGMYGSMVIQPLMLENILNYPVLTTGLAMAPRGIAGMISMYVVGKLIGRIDPRWLIATGIITCALGIYICTFYSQNIDPKWVVLPIIIQGFGLGMIFVPLSAVAFSTLPVNLRVEAAGMFSLLRTIGGSIGISVSITIFTRHAQMAWNQIGGFVQPFNPALMDYLHRLHLTMNQPMAISILADEVGRQAQMLSIVNVFAFISFCFTLMFPLVFLLKKSTHKIELPASLEE